MPQVLSSLGIQRDDVTVSRRREKDAAAGGQQPVGVRTLKDLEIPHHLAIFRIERLDAGARQRIVRSSCRNTTAGSPTEILAAALDLLRLAHVLLPTLGIREVEKSGQRAVARCLKIGRATRRRVDEKASLGAG